MLTPGPGVVRFHCARRARAVPDFQRQWARPGFIKFEVPGLVHAEWWGAGGTA